MTIIKTADGSQTIKNNEIDECYHSTNGAISESMHVFIKNGLAQISKDEINILEVGFGTGLNAMLTFIESERKNKSVFYQSIELNPISEELFSQLNYAEILGVDRNIFFEKLHKCEWEKVFELSAKFKFMKNNIDIDSFTSQNKFDIIYFDAFSPDKQPEMWSENIFVKMFNYLNKNGLLVTYSSKGFVKRNMRNVGFFVKRIEGAAGKRHMIMALKK